MILFVRVSAGETPPAFRRKRQPAVTTGESPCERRARPLLPHDNTSIEPAPPLSSHLATYPSHSSIYKTINIQRQCRMLNRSPPNLAAAAATDAPPEQPFRFLDLPKELRLLVFEELMDNPKDAIKFTTPRNLEVEEVHLDGMHYPSVLQVSKLVYDEYWSLCFRESVLWIIYGFDESAPTDEENNVDQKPTIPRLSEWVVMPIEALERVTEVFFKFKADWMLPNIGKSDQKCFNYSSLDCMLTAFRPILRYRPLCCRAV